MLLDAYTNVSYVSRRLHGTDGACVRVTYDPSGGPFTDAARGVVPIATPTLWVLNRVLVAGPDDLAGARDAQQRIHINQTSPRARRASRHGGVQRGGFFDELRAAVAIDPPAPWHPPIPAGGPDLLQSPPPAPALAEGERAGESRIRAYGLRPDRTANGWGTRSRGADFGDDVTYRAAFAMFSLAGHLPAENRSYGRALDGSAAAELRFGPGTEPPVDGFWSVSVYGPDMFFVDNEIDRYSIGDRTPGLQRATDGSLTITIGGLRPADASNWLPAPDGACFLALRAYEGRREVRDAEWFPPDLIVPAGS
jgi:hypothetical protein